MSVMKAESLYGSPLPDIVQRRMERELESIIKNGFSVMYIIAQKLVSKSLEDGYLVGSRGSVGSSFVAYPQVLPRLTRYPRITWCRNCLYSEFPEERNTGCGFDLPDKDCPVNSRPHLGAAMIYPLKPSLVLTATRSRI